MLSWASIWLSAALTAVAALFGMAPFERPWDARRLLTAALAAGCGPLIWHALTRSSTPGPLTREWGEAAFPVSRNDLGVGLATLATTSLALGLGPDRRLAAGRVATIAVGCAVAAFGLAVYLT